MLVEEKGRIKKKKKSKVSELKKKKKFLAPVCANTDIWQSVEF